MTTRESKEIVEWLALLLDPSKPLPSGKPLRLIGASVEPSLDMDAPNPHLKVRCKDGSEFVFMVVGLTYAKWRRERMEKERQVWLASPEYQRELQEARAKVEQIAVEAHSTHEGKIEHCPRPACKAALRLSAMFSDDDRPLPPKDMDIFF